MYGDFHNHKLDSLEISFIENEKNYMAKKS